MKVNGKDISLHGNETLDKLLNTIAVNKEKVVVELDGNIIPKEEFVNTVLKESNVIEVVSFVGGG